MDIINIVVILLGSLAMMGVLFGLGVILFVLAGTVGQITLAFIDALDKVWRSIFR